MTLVQKVQGTFELREISCPLIGLNGLHYL